MLSTGEDAEECVSEAMKIRKKGRAPTPHPQEAFSYVENCLDQLGSGPGLRDLSPFCSSFPTRSSGSQLAAPTGCTGTCWRSWGLTKLLGSQHQQLRRREQGQLSWAQVSRRGCRWFVWNRGVLSSTKPLLSSCCSRGSEVDCSYILSMSLLGLEARTWPVLTTVSPA